MRKLSVLIEGSSKVVNLQEGILAYGSDPHIFLKKAYIMWELYNVTSSKGNYYVLNKKLNKFLGDGYYTFQDFKKVLELNNGIKLLLHKPEAKCTMTLDSSTTLVLHQNLAGLLGFETRVFLPDSTTKSGTINVNNGLRYLRVTCSIIDESLNMEGGKKSDVLVNLPVTSSQPLFGSTQSFIDIESRVSINKGAIGQLEFHVTDQNGKPLDNYGSILLELYIM